MACCSERFHLGQKKKGDAQSVDCGVVIRIPVGPFFFLLLLLVVVAVAAAVAVAVVVIIIMSGGPPVY